MKAFSRDRNPPVARCRPPLAAGHPGLASPHQATARPESCRTAPGRALSASSSSTRSEQPGQQDRKARNSTTHTPMPWRLSAGFAGVLRKVVRSRTNRPLWCRGSRFQALDRGLAAFVGLAEYRVLEALLLPQRVGHRGVREQGVVPAERTRFVEVERLEVGEHPVAAAHAGDQAQVGRHLAEPLRGLVGRHRRHDMVAEGRAGKVEVGHHLFLGQAQVLGHARIAQVLQRVAARAVVHEHRAPAAATRGR